MAPLPTARTSLNSLTHKALVATASMISTHETSKRDLTVRGAQGTTLGAIAAYVVIIAILWNIPYVHYILWPFKVSRKPETSAKIGFPCSILEPVSKVL